MILATPFATAELAAILLCLVGMLALKIDMRRRPDNQTLRGEK